LEAAVKSFQEGAGLVADGIVGQQTWNALPGGGPMPVLREGSSGAVVESLQRVLTNGASGQWGTTPQGIDGNFGPHTKASVKAFQTWGGVAADGVVGDQTWSVSLRAASATLVWRPQNRVTRFGADDILAWRLGGFGYGASKDRVSCGRS
jgi:peptidoglycan hydrolase-like protein with peptidoglycan-binding domain